MLHRTSSRSAGSRSFDVYSAQGAQSATGLGIAVAIAVACGTLIFAALRVAAGRVLC